MSVTLTLSILYCIRGDCRTVLYTQQCFSTIMWFTCNGSLHCCAYQSFLIDCHSSLRQSLYRSASLFRESICDRWWPLLTDTSMLAVATRSPQPSFHSSAHFDNVSVGGNASESIGTQNDICKNYYLITSVES